MSDDEIKVSATLAEEEAARWKKAHEIACVGITQLNDQKADLTRALENACILIDQMLTAMREANMTPPAALLIHKIEFDKAMRKVLGHDAPEALDT